MKKADLEIGEDYAIDWGYKATLLEIVQRKSEKWRGGTSTLAKVRIEGFRRIDQEHPEPREDEIGLATIKCTWATWEAWQAQKRAAQEAAEEEKQRAHLAWEARVLPIVNRLSGYGAVALGDAVAIPLDQAEALCRALPPADLRAMLAEVTGYLETANNLLLEDGSIDEEDAADCRALIERSKWRKWGAIWTTPLSGSTHSEGPASTRRGCSRSLTSRLIASGHWRPTAWSSRSTLPPRR